MKNKIKDLKIKLWIQYYELNDSALDDSMYATIRQGMIIEFLQELDELTKE
ncbi:hypothetical protein [Leptospira bandrabouensis]|uniref:hypothetical protein n=1 Tax=Leptospira bandrabouensis TaxID=2484903 RepID=UPI001EEA7552|nr:hypothetical protein [Leptospira bandrabouensis]MCG6152595.1 hypothetical protein [Leptospira bandrabouensis]